MTAWGIDFMTSRRHTISVVDTKTVAQQDNDLEQTTVRLSGELRMRAKMAAIPAKSTLQQLFVEGLELRLALLEGGVPAMVEMAKTLEITKEKS